MKIILVFCAFILAVSANKDFKSVCQAQSQHDIEDGDCSNLSSLTLYMQKDLIVDGSILQVHTRDLYIPQSGQMKQKIACVKVIDRVMNEHGGCPFIKEGGANQNHISLHFVSQRGKEMNFHIEVYVKDEATTSATTG